MLPVTLSGVSAEVFRLAQLTVCCGVPSGVGILDWATATTVDCTHSSVSSGHFALSPVGSAIPVVFWPFTPPERDLHHDWPPSTLPLVAPGFGRSLKRTMCKLYSLENDWSTSISKINDIFFEQQKTRRSGLRGGRGEGGYLISLRLSSDNLPSTIASLDVTVPSLGSSTP